MCRDGLQHIATQWDDCSCRRGPRKAVAQRRSHCTAAAAARLLPQPVHARAWRSTEPCAPGTQQQGEPPPVMQPMHMHALACLSASLCMPVPSARLQLVHQEISSRVRPTCDATASANACVGMPVGQLVHAGAQLQLVHQNPSSRVSPHLRCSCSSCKHKCMCQHDFQLSLCTHVPRA